MKISFAKSVKLAGCLLAVVAIIWLLAMPVNSVRINDASNNVLAGVVAEKISPMLKYGWFYTDLNDIAEVLQQMPWVDTVSIARLSPLELEITITEKQPVARWKDNALVSNKGNIFFVGENNAFAKLPLLESDLEEANDTVTTYFALTQYLNLPDNKKLKGVKSISCGEVYGCRIMFGNKLLLKIGAENVNAKLQKFFHFLPKIVAKNRHKMPKSIDMRYANGAAVA